MKVAVRIKDVNRCVVSKDLSTESENRTVSVYANFMDDNGKAIFQVEASDSSGNIRVALSQASTKAMDFAKRLNVSGPFSVTEEFTIDRQASRLGKTRSKNKKITNQFTVNTVKEIFSTLEQKHGSPTAESAAFYRASMVQVINSRKAIEGIYTRQKESIDIRIKQAKSAGNSSEVRELEMELKKLESEKYKKFDDLFNRFY